MGGVIDMTPEERGGYIMLLCVQWTKGFVPNDDKKLEIISGVSGPALKAIKSKFDLGQDGNLRQHRLEEVREEQNEYRASKIEKAKKGAAARWKNAPSNARALPQASNYAPSNAQASVEQCSRHAPPTPTPTPKHEREHNFAERPSLEEALTHASFIGLAPWKAEDWWNEMESCGWLDFQHRPVVLWRPMLQRVKAKWEADGRPKTPPTRLLPNGQPVPPVLDKSQKRLEAREQYIIDMAEGRIAPT